MGKIDKTKLIPENIIGKGMQTTAYRYADGLIIKEVRDTSIEYLKKLKSFYKKLSEFKLNLAFPQIEEITEEDNKIYLLEREIDGVELMTILHKLDIESRRKLLIKYFDTLDELKKISFNNSNYGELFAFSNKEINSDSWKEFLIQRMKVSFSLGGKFLVKHIHDIDSIFNSYLEEISKFEYSDEKCLVHGDYFPKNVFVDSNFNISHLIDFSELTLVGDHRVDIAGSIIFLKDWLDSDIEFLYKYAVKKFGEEIEYYIWFYKIYYSFRFSNCKDLDPGLFKWCVKNLRG